MRCYDYRCEDCGRAFEELVDSPEDEVRCPGCGGTHAARQLSGFAIGRSSGGSSASASASGGDGGGGCWGGGCAGGMCGVPN